MFIERAKPSATPTTPTTPMTPMTPTPTPTTVETHPGCGSPAHASRAAGWQKALVLFLRF
jgi:hypothetical protein